MKIMSMLSLKLLAIVMAVLLIGGCAWMQNLMDGGKNEQALRVAVTVAVLDLTTEHPEYKERILEITKATRSYLDGAPPERASDITNFVAKQIQWDKLSPGQTIVATALLTSIEAELQKRIEQGGVDPNRRLNAIQIVDWVEQAAQN